MKTQTAMKALIQKLGRPPLGSAFICAIPSSENQQNHTKPDKASKIIHRITYRLQLIALVGSHEGHAGDDVHGEGDQEGAHDRVDGSEEGNGQRQEPDEEDHGNSSGRLEKKHSAVVNPHELLPGQKERVHV